VSLCDKLHALPTLALGPIVPEIDLASLGSLHLATVDKTLFSMLHPQVIPILQSRPSVDSIVLFGIEVFPTIFLVANVPLVTAS
jgi:hypothetical protein